MTRTVKGQQSRTSPAPGGDGRSTRWSAHRQRRRAELVEAAVAAIDRHGRDVGVAGIAATAGVSKPVLYRYFADKADLHTAVGAWGADLVLQRLLPSLAADVPLEERVRRGVDAYLATIEEHPNVFLLLVRHRVKEDVDPLADGKAAIAAAIARVMGDVLRGVGVDTGGAVPWAHGVVGLGLAVGEWWLTSRTMSRAAVTRYLTAFLWNALAGLSQNYGVPLAPPSGGPLRLLPGPEQEAGT